MVAFEAMELWFPDSGKIRLDKAYSGRLHIFICDVPSFDPFPRPGCFPEKRETGFHARIMEETADGDPASHLGPAISLDQFFDDGFQRDPMQRIAGMGGTHERMANGIGVMAADQDYDVWLDILHERGSNGL
jgi:hypothetical protein